MAPHRGRNRAGEFEDLIAQPNTEFDPEVEDIQPSDDSAADDDDDASGREDDLEARSHYVDVGKSKLRKPKATPLGPQYRGAHVDRDALSEDDAENDPFSKDFDDESSEVGIGYSDEQSEDDEDEDTPETDVSDEGPQHEEEDVAEIKKAMATEPKEVTGSILEAAKLDAAKGKAVLRQRKAFDALLNTRIKLQKAMVGTNSVVALQRDNLDTVEDSIVEAAEKAAFTLWSSLNDLREQLDAARTGSKRKRNSFEPNTPTTRMWERLQRQEEGWTDTREATLQRWSRKAQGVSTMPAQNRLNNTQTQTTVMDGIREHLTNSDRLLKRVHTPRSCAPMQLEKGIGEDERIYDDADFYGLLLKELLEQKTQDASAVANVDLSFQLRREAKTKKVVDTKASKGRKLRYTVHEKLQNFMAPEDRGAWGQRQADELFGSLFGQRLGLGEGREEDADVEMDDLDAAEAGLMLFRS